MLKALVETKCKREHAFAKVMWMSQHRVFLVCDFKQILGKARKNMAEKYKYPLDLLYGLNILVLNVTFDYC